MYCLSQFQIIFLHVRYDVGCGGFDPKREVVQSSALWKQKLFYQSLCWREAVREDTVWESEVVGLQSVLVIVTKCEVDF